MISQAEEKPEEDKEEKKVVDFDTFDTFDFMTDVSQRGDVYGVAENVIKDIDKDKEIEVVNNVEKNNPMEGHEISSQDENATTKQEQSDEMLKDFVLTDEKPEETSAAQEEPVAAQEEQIDVKPKKKAGRPRKIVTEPKTNSPKRGRGRPKKSETANQTAETAKIATKRPGRPKKVAFTPATNSDATKKIGRPKKIVKENVNEQPLVKRGRGRPKKHLSSILEINKRLSEEEAKLQAMRKSINDELEEAMNEMNASSVDDKQARREELLKEIDELQEEAQDVMTKNESESKITEINAKLESLLEEIKKLNS